MNYAAEAMTDSYKVGMSQLHKFSLYGNIIGVLNSYSNFTPRKNCYMEFCDQSDGHLVVYGTRDTFQYLFKVWDATFFNTRKHIVMKRIKRRLVNHFGSLEGHDNFIESMSDLHDLGFLPVEVRAIDEGTKYPVGLPVFTVKSTIDSFGWVVNFIETITSGLIWPMINTATKVEQFYLQAKHFGHLSAPENMVNNWLPTCVHEFGMRGYRGPEDQVRTSSASSLFFVGSDTNAVIDFFEDSYDADSDNEDIAISIRASEHADVSRMLSLFRHLAAEALETSEYRVVGRMSSAEEQKEFKISTLGDNECVQGYRGGFFINENEEPVEISPFIADPLDVLANTEFYVLRHFADTTGIISYVSDTENYYRLINDYADRLSGMILSREEREDGQPAVFVFRPDSSRRTPLTVICGYRVADISDINNCQHELNQDMCFYDSASDEYFLWDLKSSSTIRISEDEAKGSLVSLWNTFGGETIDTRSGPMRVINPKVGLIYGEAISQSHQKDIYKCMIEMGFSVVNILIGKGSYASLENSTRDLLSMSYKQTFSEVSINGNRVNLSQQKSPMGDISKKSARGLLCVVDKGNGEFELEQDVSEEREQEGALTLLAYNGKMIKKQTLKDIKSVYGE